MQHFNLSPYLLSCFYLCPACRLFVYLPQGSSLILSISKWWVLFRVFLFITIIIHLFILYFHKVIFDYIFLTFSEILQCILNVAGFSSPTVVSRQCMFYTTVSIHGWFCFFFFYQRIQLIADHYKILENCPVIFDCFQLFFFQKNGSSNFISLAFKSGIILTY